MKMKSFKTNNPNQNPFNKEVISDKQFKHMLENGFKLGVLDCYAELTGNICYCKCSYNIGPINIYITENGIAVDNDFECGGNSYNRTWWIQDTTLLKSNYSIDYSEIIESQEERRGIPFEQAWDEMVDEVIRLESI